MIRDDETLKMAYKMLNATSSNTMEEIKHNFKLLAVKYHPDKGGDENIFNLLVDSFKKVHNHKKNMELQREHEELKIASKDNINSQIHNHSVSIMGNSDNAEQFNSKFNEYFTQHRTIDKEAERGYQNFMNETKVTTSEKHYKIQKYKEPEPSVLCKSLAFHELGTKTKDFSGKNDDMKRLQYMDYQYAHTTDKIIDPSQVRERKEFKSVDDLIQKRENEAFDLTDKEKNYYEKMKEKELRREQKRVQNVQIYDQYLDSHQKKLNQLRIT